MLVFKNCKIAGRLENTLSQNRSFPAFEKSFDLRNCPHKHFSSVVHALTLMSTSASAVRIFQVVQLHWTMSQNLERLQRKFETLTVRAGHKPDPGYGAVVAPISTSSSKYWRHRRAWYWWHSETLIFLTSISPSLCFQKWNREARTHVLSLKQSKQGGIRERRCRMRRSSMYVENCTIHCTPVTLCWPPRSCADTCQYLVSQMA